MDAPLRDDDVVVPGVDSRPCSRSARLPGAASEFRAKLQIRAIRVRPATGTATHRTSAGSTPSAPRLGVKVDLVPGRPGGGRGRRRRSRHRRASGRPAGSSGPDACVPIPPGFDAGRSGCVEITRRLEPDHPRLPARATHVTASRAVDASRTAAGRGRRSRRRRGSRTGAAPGPSSASGRASSGARPAGAGRSA